jgi:hypothetical protein
MFLAKSVYQLFFIIPMLVFFNLLIACNDSTPAQGELNRGKEAGQFSFELVSSPMTSNLFQTDELVTVETTLVNEFLPLVPAEVRDGSCQANSRAVNEPYAWRCQVEGQIFDPCLTAADGQSIVCGADPLDWEGFKVNLNQPLPPPDSTPEKAQATMPWLIELADGVACRLTMGKTRIEGRRVTYLCSDDTQILGHPQQGSVWKAEKVVLDESYPGWQIKTLKWVDIFAIWQTVDPNSLVEEIGLSPDQVQMDISGLAHTLQGRVVPAVYPKPGELPALNEEPAHLRFNFDGEPLAPWVNPSFERQLLIYPVAAYRQLFQTAGLFDVDQQVKTLRRLLDERPQDGEKPLPLLPPLGQASPDLTAQVKYLDFKGGSGVRFIARFTQKARPCSNEEIFYTFQGLTADGRYYVALFYPISTWTLPDNTDTLAPEEVTKITANYQAYREQIQKDLNALNPADFTPDLSTLDAMVASLEIEPEGR